ELVVVPHTHKRPTRPRVLKIRVEEIGSIQRPVVINRSRDMKVTNLLTVLVSNNIAKSARVHACRPVFGIPHDLVNEVPEVKDKGKLLGRGPLLVLPDHSSKSVASALLYILTTHEREVHLPRVVARWSRDSPANPASKAILIGKPIPVDP